MAAHGDLHVQLDAPLPETVAVGAGTALFVCGTCFAPDARIAGLELLVDGAPQSLLAHGMPRLDTLRSLGDGYASGFWGLARIAAGAGPCVVLGLRARLAAGGERIAALARILVAAPEVRPAVPAAEIAVCMATFEPPPELFRRQIESLRAQTHTDWVCVISDDCSAPDRFAALTAVVEGDPRFVVARSPRRLGFYRNFERALALAPAGSRFVAPADQDDAWDPDKLATLRAELGGARLVYSDARVIGAGGDVVAETYWARRRPNHTDLLSLLVANSVTGAAALFPRALLDDALPFPPGQFAHFHDHWLALCALATGAIRFVDRPLYDYVQHGGATLGHAAANRMPSLRERFGALRRDPRERIRLWRMHYFVDACRLLQLAAVLELRCGERMPPAKRAALARLVRAERSPAAIAALAARGARDLSRARPETLGAEWMLAHAFAWRRALALSARAAPQARGRLDAVPPPALDPRPGARAIGDPALRELAEKIAPLRLAVRDDAPQRVNVLIPTFDLQHFFGGYIAKLNLARRLAERGARVRVVTVDPVGTLPLDWAGQVERYSGLAGLFERAEVAFGRESPGLEVSRADRFVATTWWTAHIAAAAARALDGDARFLYLIQEYEPFTFPMGSHAALAAESYRLPHAALFSTELLRGYFRAHGLGVYAAGAAAGDAASAAFENAITDVTAPPAEALAARRPRRLLFYARPEPHAARNMFELGALALARAVAGGAFDGWELHGIGTIGSRRRLDLGGATLELLPRAAQDDYADLLRAHDVGLALMYTPHPSLVPIEMAAAGMLTVTNSFENKTAAALAAISPNLICAEPGIEAVAAALTAAAADAGDAGRRVRGSTVAWSRDWDAAFPDALLARVAGLLQPTRTARTGE